MAVRKWEGVRRSSKKRAIRKRQKQRKPASQDTNGAKHEKGAGSGFLLHRVRGGHVFNFAHTERGRTKEKKRPPMRLTGPVNPGTPPFGEPECHSRLDAAKTIMVSARPRVSCGCGQENVCFLLLLLCFGVLHGHDWAKTHMPKSIEADGLADVKHIFLHRAQDCW